MKGIRYSEHGPPDEVLSLVDLPEPRCGEGQIKVQVIASPIDPADLLAVRGLYAIQPPLPACPGMEGCGRVVESRRPGFAEGDLVLLPMRSGAWCERVVVDAADLLPAHSDPVQACMLRINPPTAELLLEGLEEGDWVIQDPASSSVGQLVIQLARRRGVRTVSVVRRPAREEFLKSLGADLVVPRTRRGLPTCERALDGMGGEAVERLARCLREGAEVISYGAVGREAARLSVAQTVFRDIRLRGFWLYRVNEADKAAEAARLQRLGRWLADGELRIEIAGTFGLDRWREAVALAESPDRDGKVVFTP